MVTEDANLDCLIFCEHDWRNGGNKANHDYIKGDHHGLEASFLGRLLCLMGINMRNTKERGDHFI